MWAALTLAAVLAQPAVPVLAAPGLTTTGLDPSVAGPLTNHLARALTGTRVITAADIGALVGLERQKELLGCTDGASACMAELGNALGAEGVLLGDLAKLGEVVQINVRIIAPGDGRVLATAATRVDSEAAIFDALTALGPDLSAQFLAAIGRGRPAAPEVLPPLPSPDEPRMLPPDEPLRTVRTGTRRFFPAALAVGAASLGVGAAFLAWSEGIWQQLVAGKPRSLSIAEADALARNGKAIQLTAAVFGAAGAAVALFGAGLFFFGSEGERYVALSPSGFAIAGTF